MAVPGLGDQKHRSEVEPQQRIGGLVGESLEGGPKLRAVVFRRAAARLRRGMAPAAGEGQREKTEGHAQDTIAQELTLAPPASCDRESAPLGE